MLDAFIYFIAGATTLRVLQFVLSVKPNYYIFKETENTTLMILAGLHVNKLTALNILKLIYEDVDRQEDFEKVKIAINERYNALITRCITSLKSALPYKVEYNSLDEAMKIYFNKAKEKKDVE